tara:strand:- start:266 stop:478 length:213 start_codon:yes stop_codon:yes gene_type:complete
MSLVTSVEQYNNILQIKATENKVIYEILDSNQTTGLSAIWVMMVNEAKEANNTSLTVDEDTGSNYSWSSC